MPPIGEVARYNGEGQVISYERYCSAMKSHLVAMRIGISVCIILGALGAGFGSAQAADEFHAVRCGGDVHNALIGRRTANGPVAGIEARHSDLNLKDLGGDEISTRLNSISWSICGKEYVLLSDASGLVQDVLPFLAHSRIAPQFSGLCRLGAHRQSGVVIAVLNNASERMSASSHYAPDDGTLLPVKVAWTVDEKSSRFVPASTRGLYCPRNGIITANGGP
jgi:hypothetical protein